ncbi:MAG: RSP_2647 family RNA methyltransferase [Pikeienuella sp.]|uniref:RSP_2647 family RNA methyltransferase n=1 Tax=Pikeienuella sp. TaxID=2831957 RepID=UPI00391C16C5
MPESDAARPVIRLRPNRGRRFFEGAPWLYDDEIVTDRRTKALAPGTIATLESAERAPLATVTVNPGSTIMARVLDADPEAEIGPDWLRRRLAAALAHRERLYPDPYYRLVHAEGDGLPGLVIDRFGAAAAVQPNAAWAEAMRGEICDALAAVAGVTTIVVNGAGRARALEGLEAEVFVERGDVAGPRPVPMNGAFYLADLLGGQKTGLFYDQRPNHAFVAALSAGAEVLDVFSHVGGFALACLARGAATALAVDSSAPALALAEQGAAAGGAADRFATRRGQAFDVMRALRDEGRSYDVVISDPPAFAPAKAALEKGLRAYETAAKLAASLTRPGGYLCLCSCSHAATPDLFRSACVAGIRASGRTASLVHEGRAGPDHPAHFALPETSYLKALVFRLA